MTRLEELLKKYYDNTATEWEKAEFFSLVLRSDREELAVLISQTAVSADLDGSALEDRKVNKIIHSILRHNSQPHVPAKVYRLPIIKTTWFRYCAGLALLLVGLGVYFVLTRSHKPASDSLVNNLPAIQHDVLPGGDRAVLTLSTGQRVILDSSASTIISDGNTPIEISNGHLIYKNTGTSATNTMRTPKGGQYKLTLADGTRVWLNAASSITFPTVFKGNSREVSVSGEVFFEVAKDPEAPFIVDVNSIAKVQVLGTSFNINAYIGDSLVRTTLIEGAVRVNASGKSHRLQPAQQSVLSFNGQLSINSSVNTEKVIAWKNGVFNFDGSELKEVMRQLERWYDIKVEYVGQPPALKFVGELPRDLTLSQVIETLREIGIKFQLVGRTLKVVK